MNLISKSEAMIELKPFAKGITESVENAWTHLSVKFQDSFRYEIRTKSNIMRDNTVSFLRETFYQTPGVEFLEKGQNFYLHINNKYKLRFNKFNNNFFPHKSNSRQAILFNEQMELFPDFVTANLNAGYIINKSWSDYVGPYITCPTGQNSIYWLIDIRNELMEPQVAIPAPSTQNTNETNTSINIITIKPTIIRKEPYNGAQS